MKTVRAYKNRAGCWTKEISYRNAFARKNTVQRFTFHTEEEAMKSVIKSIKNGYVHI